MVNLHGRPATVTLADVAEIPFAHRSFDIVLTKDVIEHAADYRPILSELGRLAGRYLVLSMFIRLHDAPDMIRLEPQGFHHNRYNRSGLYAHLEAIGFGEPQIIYAAPTPRHSGFQDEVLVFERKD